MERHNPTAALIRQEQLEAQQTEAEKFADLKLRQWCVEQAVKVNYAVEFRANLAKEFYNFITNKEAKNAETT